MQIIDNYLDPQTFQLLQNNIIFNESFPWRLTRGISDLDDGSYYFAQFFYLHYTPQPLYTLVDPLVQKIRPRALFRIKANFYPTTSLRVQHEMHQDTKFTHQGAIFYLNSNNGKTIFNTGEEIDSVENRLLLFDPSVPHCSTTCTDDPVGRFNLNMNYF